MDGGALFRVDAGPAIGLGHLQRSTALARVLIGRSVNVTVLAPRLDVVVSKTATIGAPHVPLAVQDDALGSAADLAQTLDVARQLRAHTVVVDSYRVRGSYLQTLREADLRIVVFDDLVEAPTPAHVLINGAVGADASGYRSTTGDTLFLLGPRYAVLQAGFADVPERQPPLSAARLLVVVGGADPHRLLPRILEWLEELGEPFEIDAVVGPFSNAPPAGGAHRHPTRFLYAPESLHLLMRSSDLVVCGAGQTLYEAAASGTPSVAIQLFENQERTYAGFLAAGAVRGAGVVGDSALGAQVVAAVRDLVGDPVERTSLSRAGRRLVDGRGAERVADAIGHA